MLAVKELSMSNIPMPPAKVGKTYPITYFSNYNKAFKAREGEFELYGWKFERIGRNQIKVLHIPNADSN